MTNHLPELGHTSPDPRPIGPHRAPSTTSSSSALETSSILLRYAVHWTFLRPHSYLVAGFMNEALTAAPAGNHPFIILVNLCG